MTDQQELRVGICTCSSVFNGQLVGTDIDISGTSFRVQEVSIDKGSQMASIRSNRPHLFLDVDPWRDSIKTELLLVHMISHHRRIDTVLLGMPRGLANKRSQLEKVWLGRIPAVEGIIESIPEILNQIYENRFDLWLARMTPPGWTLPEQNLMHVNSGTRVVCASPN